MISAITADPLSTSSIGLSNYRARPSLGERTVLPDSTPPAPKHPDSESGSFPQHEREAAPLPDAPRHDAASMFAAAVIAGTLPPVPTTMEQLILRIGAIPIPPESEGRLKDLLA